MVYYLRKKGEEMGRRRRTNFSLSLHDNMQLYWYYYDRLKELAISSFTYKNMPDTIDVRYLEMTLFEKGVAVLFEDEVLGYLALSSATNGRWNVYNIPMRRRAYASNGYQKKLDNTNSVLMYNNMLHYNSVSVCEMFARKLYNIDQTINVNVNAQKTPILLTCAENERLSVLNMYKEYDGNQPVIFGNKNLNSQALQVLKTDAPYLADRLYELKNETWNEALTYFGIPNVNIQKKERLITDEVQRSQGGTIASRNSRLKAREQAVDMFNDMFGLNVEVDYADQFDTILNEQFITDLEEEGGSNNE